MILIMTFEGQHKFKDVKVKASIIIDHKDRQRFFIFEFLCFFGI